MAILYSILFFAFGTLFSSFFHLLTQRLVHKETLLGRSYCCECHHELRFVDVLPVLGYVINRGKCHFCGKKIALNYLITEIFGGAMFALSYLVVGFTWELGISLIMICVLIAESISDYQSMIVLDRIWIVGVVLIIIIRIIQGEFLIYLLSSAGMFGLMLLLALFGKWVFKKEAIGGGDVKLYIFIGFCLTIWQGLLSLFLASLFGLIYAMSRKDRNNRVLPLVPFIFLGTLVAFFFGRALIDWYLHLLGV